MLLPVHCGQCCLPTGAQGSSDPVTGNVGIGVFLGILVAPRVLCIWEVLALLVFPLMSAGIGLWRCAYRWTRPSGRVRWFAQKCASCNHGGGSNSIVAMLGFAEPPVVHKTWVTSVCLLLDTPVGRRSVEALSS